MILRPLVIDDDAKSKIKRILDFASKPENYYVLEEDGTSKQEAPGFNYRYTTKLNSFRVVFTMTWDKRTQYLFRHLSVSIPRNIAANPIAVYTIATEFGFTGWSLEQLGMTSPNDWISMYDPEENAVKLLQVITDQIGQPVAGPK